MTKIIIENSLLLIAMFSKKLIFRSHYWVRGSKPTRMCFLKIWLKNKGIIEMEACFLRPQSLTLGMIYIQTLRNMVPLSPHKNVILRPNDG